MSIDSLCPNLEDLGWVKNSFFYSMSRAVDGMLTKRLIEFNSMQSWFLGAVTDENRMILQDQNRKQVLRDTNVEQQVLKITELLQNQRHDPELTTTYILLGVALFLQVVAVFLIQILKNRLVYWILKNQADQAISYAPGRPYSEAPQLAPCCPASMPPSVHTPLVERLCPKAFKEESMNTAALNFSA